MKERPILMKAENVVAILEGRKTQTRRSLKPQPPEGCTVGWSAFSGCSKIECRSYAIPHQSFIKVPYGKKGDKLWVKETFQHIHAGKDGQYRILNAIQRPGYGFVEYAATPQIEEPPKWKPSIFMPRWASRITLEITQVRVERLHDIGKDGRKAHDVLAEGITDHQIEQWRKYLHPDDAPAHTYGVLWEQINGKGSWAKNPWVWVIEFKKL